MRRFLTLLSVFFVVQVFSADSKPLSSAQINALLAHSERPVEDVQRDAARSPEKVLAFTQVAQGQHVLDIFAGGGWYSELFSHAVGNHGKVYVQNDEVIWRFAEKPINERTADNRLANLVRFDNMPIVDIDIPDNSLDIIFTALNYHDLFFTEFTQDGVVNKVREDIVDYKSALARLKQALKEDGTFIIIDHAAEPGSGYEAANVQHRIDPDIVKFQMNEAGFTLVEEAYFLRNLQDDLSMSVFDTAVRGKTDRFVYKFKKR